MAKILMIGAGIGQLFLSQKIKERGDELIAVTLPGHQPVIEIADKVYYNDVFDREGVLRIAQNEVVDGVISDQNDMMMPTVAYVAEKMALPGLNVAQVKAYCNKNLFRDNCDRLNIPVPRHIEVREAEIPDSFRSVPFPWIVKPADSQSSVGVQKVCSEREYLVAIEKALGYSKTHSAILEEFFQGQELVAEGFIYKGKYYNLGFADRKYFDLDRLFIPSQTIFPSQVDIHVLEQIARCEERMADFVRPDFAIVHSEYLYDKNSGEYRVVESALRGGGVYISSHLIPLYCSIDINDVLLDCVSGKSVDVAAILSRRINKAAGYMCFYLPEGEIVRADGMHAVLNMDCVKMMCVNDVSVGDLTPPLTHKGQRLGPIIVSGNNREDMEQSIAAIQQTLDVRVMGKDGCEYKIKWE